MLDTALALAYIDGMKVITYFAAAVNPDGRIGQLLVTRTYAIGACERGALISKKQEWTGVVYRTQRAAVADLTRLNCGRS